MADTEKITLRDDFKRYLRPLTGAEHDCLESLILAEGCLSPLIVWVKGKQRILVDGYKRIAICRKHDLPYKVEEKEFANEEEVLRWMVKTARARRNQTRSERLYYLGARYLREKQTHGGKERFNGASDKVCHMEDRRTCERIAEEEGVSRNTVQNAGKFTARVDELSAHVGHDDDFKWMILAEQVKFGGKLYQALKEATPQQAFDALLAAREGKGKDDRPVTAAAVLKHLPGGDAKGEKPFNFDAAFGTISDTIYQIAGKVKRSELASMTVRLKGLVGELESRLGGKARE